MKWGQDRMVQRVILVFGVGFMNTLGKAQRSWRPVRQNTDVKKILVCRPILGEIFCFLAWRSEKNESLL